MKIVVFRTGKHTDSKGNTREWTEADLDRMVSGYDPASHEAPVVIGHPKDNDPAFGWVESIAREGQNLVATLKDLVPEFVEAWTKGLFKKRSISLYPDLTLRHVGFLGAMPPAVKGLPDFKFSDKDESTTIDFSDETGWKVTAIGRLLSSLRDMLIEKFGLETADRVLPGWDVNNLLQEPDPKPNQAFSQETINLTEEGKMTPEEIKELKDKNAALEAQVADLSAQLAEAKKKETEAAAAADMAEHAGFCEGLIKEGKMTPAQKEVCIVTMQALSGQAEQEFAEGDKRVKKTPLQAFKDQLSAMPVQVEFAEVAGKKKAGQGGQTTEFSAPGGEVIPESAELDKKARDLMAQDKTLSYREAVHRALEMVL
ncbi:MAG: hypothetical protein RDU76_11545 [Candidatus Edwardsbacteria bacterium]|nr:hypothetical protein [Candidatus Edwardsbacteria bacterium]